MPLVFLSAKDFIGRKNSSSQASSSNMRDTLSSKCLMEKFLDHKIVSVRIEKHSLLKKKNVFPSLLLLPVNMVSVLRLRQNRLKSSRLPLLSIRQQPTNNKSQIMLPVCFHPCSLPPPLF